MTMEETREPQQPSAAPLVYPAQPVYPAPQPPYYAPAPKIGRFVRFRRLMRLLLRRLLYGSVVVGRVIRPYAGFVVAIIALLGVIGWMSYLLWGPQDARSAGALTNDLPGRCRWQDYRNRLAADA